MSPLNKPVVDTETARAYLAACADLGQKNKVAPQHLGVIAQSLTVLNKAEINKDEVNKEEINTYVHQAVDKTGFKRRANHADSFFHDFSDKCVNLYKLGTFRTNDQIIRDFVVEQAYEEPQESDNTHTDYPTISSMLDEFNLTEPKLTAELSTLLTPIDVNNIRSIERNGNKYTIEFHNPVQISQQIVKKPNDNKYMIYNFGNKLEFNYNPNEHEINFVNPIPVFSYEDFQLPIDTKTVTKALDLHKIKTEKNEKDEDEVRAYAKKDIRFQWSNYKSPLHLFAKTGALTHIEQLIYNKYSNEPDLGYFDGISIPLNLKTEDLQSWTPPEGYKP